MSKAFDISNAFPVGLGEVYVCSISRKLLCDLALQFYDNRKMIRAEGSDGFQIGIEVSW